MPPYNCGDGLVRYCGAHFRRLDLISPVTPPLFILLNIGSGQGDASAARATIEGACAEAGRKLHLVQLDPPDRITELAKGLVLRAQQDGGIVVAAGGGGTINAVAQANLGSGRAFGV